MRIAESVRQVALGALLIMLGFSVVGTVAVGQQADTVESAAQPSSPPEKTIKMSASNWAWKPDVIRVGVGTRLRLEFQSYDASHSFDLKDYGIKQQLPEGKPAVVEFVADRPGEFKWRCGRPCGNGCAKMVGKLIVE